MNSKHSILNSVS